MFVDEIINMLGLSGVLPQNYSIYNYCGRGVLIQGDVKLLHSSKTKFEIRLAKEHYIVLGENMEIKQLSKGELFIAGKIVSVSKE